MVMKEILHEEGVIDMVAGYREGSLIGVNVGQSEVQGVSQKLSIGKREEGILWFLLTFLSQKDHQSLHGNCGLVVIP
jgi:hypothetical protein